MKTERKIFTSTTKIFGLFLSCAMYTYIDWSWAEELNVDPAEVHGEAEAEPGEADEGAAEAPARAAAVAEAGQARDELGRSGCDQTLGTGITGQLWEETKAI